MEAVIEANPAPASKKMLWTGYILSALPALMLLFSGAMKFMKLDGMEEGLEHLGWKMSQMTGLGILEIACTVLYIIPQTSMLGAILLTGYLGGATATHVRVGDPWFMTVILGILVWVGLYLRDGRLRALIPIRT